MDSASLPPHHEDETVKCRQVLEAFIARGLIDGLPGAMANAATETLRRPRNQARCISLGFRP